MSSSRQIIDDKQIEDFVSFFQSKSFECLNVDDYYLRYLQHLNDHLLYYIHVFAHQLNLAIEKQSLSRSQISLVDYGAGNGLMGMFAKYCGIGHVYINDINPLFVEGARQLSDLLETNIDGFIVGDIDAVKHFFENKTLNTLVSFDVIEHVYDLNKLLHGLHDIHSSMVLVFGTGINAHNPFKVRKIKKLQRKDEYEGGSPDDYTLYGHAANASFRQMRADIIRAAAPALAENQVQQLTSHTRGMSRADIEKSVDDFLLTNTLPTLINHPTNTCDPYSGSWTERLLTIKEYRNLFENAGFQLKVHPGFYNQYDSGFKSTCMKLVNGLVKILGIPLASYISLVASSKSE